MGIVAVVAAAALLATGPRWPFRSWWTAAGAVAAVALAAPYLVWQQQHGWPQVTVAGNIGGSAEGGRIGFVPFQLLLVSPVLVPGVGRRAARAVPPRRAAGAALRPGDLPRAAGGLPGRRRQGLLPRKPLSAAARTRRGSGRGLDAAVAPAWLAAVGGDRPLGGRERVHRAAAAAGAVAAGQRRDRDQPRPGRDGRLATVRRHGRGRVAADPAGRARAHRDLHAELRRGRRDRPPRQRSPAAARLQRPQRLQRMGTARRSRHARARSSATTAHNDAARTSPAAAASAPSTTASASTTTNKASRSSSADPPTPGPRSGRTSPTTTERTGVPFPCPWGKCANSISLQSSNDPRDCDLDRGTNLASRG